MKKFMVIYLKICGIYYVAYFGLAIVIGQLIRHGVIKEGKFKDAAELWNASTKLGFRCIKSYFKKDYDWITG